MDSNLRVSEPNVPLATTAPTPTATVPVASWSDALLREVLETVVPALVIAMAMVAFVVQPTRVEGHSMEPTLHTGQRLVIEKVSYRFHPPTTGDIVVLRLDGREDVPIIKRVIGTPGDEVAIRAGRVYLNGVPLAEDYVEGRYTSDGWAPAVVPDGYLFVLGDNRGTSKDSRHFGLVPMENLVGRAIVSYWPSDDVGLVD